MLNEVSFCVFFQALLNSTSYGLYQMTGGGNLRTVEVTLPESWSQKCRTGSPVEFRTSSHPALSRPEISVTGTEMSGFGSLRAPWAEQTGGCGVSGNRIHVPLGYFKSQNEKSAKGEFNKQILLLLTISCACEI